jgi:succinate dehydrogenase/fumarate reductase flavoprotein subunit
MTVPDTITSNGAGGAADVVVIGSGAAGLAAAIAAHDCGASVIVVEASEKFGGATAVSGGMVWIPNSDQARERKIDDSRDDAITHLRYVAGPSVAQGNIEAFIDNAPRVLRYLLAHTPVSLQLVEYPDYHMDAPGARAEGRVFDNNPFATAQLGELSRQLRRSPTYPPITAKEWLVDGKWDESEIARRGQDGVVTFGCALAGALLLGCTQRGIPLRNSTRVERRSVRDDGAAVLTASTPTGDISVVAKQAAILATGGYEWNDAFKEVFLQGRPITGPASPPTSNGDGLRLAMAAGAGLANMGEAWWFPTVHLADEEFEGHPLYRMLFAERTLPHSVIVNSRGKRFVNESMNYNDMTRAMHEMDPSDNTYRNIPAFFVFDGDYRKRYPVFGTMPDQPDSTLLKGIFRAESVQELARAVNIDAQGLVDQLEEFNRLAAKGLDPVFHRGESSFDRFEGDAAHSIHPNLAPVKTPPFFAVEVHPGALGTKGGPVTDQWGRVLDAHGDIIPNLFAVGNVAASVGGVGYTGAGATLGPALTFGTLAGSVAARGLAGVDELLGRRM